MKLKDPAWVPVAGIAVSALAGAVGLFVTTPMGKAAVVLAIVISSIVAIWYLLMSVKKSTPSVVEFDTTICSSSAMPSGTGECPWFKVTAHEHRKGNHPRATLYDMLEIGPIALYGVPVLVQENGDVFVALTVSPPGRRYRLVIS